MDATAIDANFPLASRLRRDEEEGAAAMPTYHIYMRRLRSDESFFAPPRAGGGFSAADFAAACREKPPARGVDRWIITMRAICLPRHFELVGGRS